MENVLLYLIDFQKKGFFYKDDSIKTFLSPVSSGSSSSKTGDFSVYLIVNIKSIIIH